MQICGVLYEELINVLNLMEWFVTFKQDLGAMSQLYKQLASVLDCLKILLLIDMQLGSSQEQLIRIFSKFYTFMIHLCKSVS
jgi:hypothetical protein